MVHELGRHCSTCNKNRLWEDFNKSKWGRNGYYSICRDCCKAKQQERYFRVDKFTLSLRKYGLSKEEFLDLYNSQNKACAICYKSLDIDTTNSKRQCSVDHCHESGKVRGLLCHHCNIGLGMFKDNKDFLSEAINYLDRDVDASK